MVRRKINFDYSFGSGEGTNVLSESTPTNVAEKTPESVVAPVAIEEPRQEEAPMVEESLAERSLNEESVVVEDVNPQQIPESGGLKPARSKGRRSKKTKEDAAGDSRNGYRQMNVTSDVYLMFTRYKKIWELSEKLPYNASNTDFMRFLLERFLKEKKLLLEL